MGWDVIAGLILTQGVPLVTKLIENWSNKTPVTMEEWDKVKAIAQTTARQRMEARLAAAGIPLDDPKALALLAMTD